MTEEEYLMVTVRDINLLCQHFKTYAQIEGQTRRRKITRARRRNGALEVRTASRDEWVQPVATRVFTVLNPEIVGNKYLVVGTLDRVDWKRIEQNKLPVQDTIEALHDFKEVVIFEPVGGWSRWYARYPWNLDSRRRT